MCPWPYLLGWVGLNLLIEPNLNCVISNLSTKAEIEGGGRGVQLCIDIFFLHIEE